MSENQKRAKKILRFGIYIIIIILGLFLLTAIMRIGSSRQLDDLSPQIFCEKENLDKSDILFVIPKLDNISIANNQTWCKEISSLNKTLAMHGVYHTYYELSKTRDIEYINEGREIFKQCFGYYPKIFKPSQMGINKENKNLIKQSDMILISPFNQLMHKAYHCSDTGAYSNRMMDWF